MVVAVFDEQHPIFNNTIHLVLQSKQEDQNYTIMIVEILPKIAILIGTILSILPFPLLYRAIAKGDQRELMSLSVPATIMGVSSTSAVLAYCQENGLDECSTSCYIGLVSGALTLLTIFAMRRDYRTLMILIAS